MTNPAESSSSWSVPVTEQRRAPKLALLEKIHEAGLPRVTRAVTSDRLEGTPGQSDTRSVLQKHVDFFDRNKDGVITPLETFQGFRAIGFNLVLSLLGSMLIHLAMSYLTVETLLPHPLFYIYTKNIHHCKHGSDQQVYDHEGRFRPEQYEEIFSKFDKKNKGYLTKADLWEMTQAMKDTFDIFGWTASKLEFIFLYHIANVDGKIDRETLRANYDGSLFEKLEKREISKRNKE